MRIKKIFSAIFCITVTSLICISSLLAETIILKSGKSIEAPIIEKNAKYIKVDIDGVPVTYYREDIKSINGIEAGREPSAKKYLSENEIQPKIQEESLSSESSDWTSWYASVSLYMMEINKVNAKIQRFQAQMQTLQMQSQNGNKEQVLSEAANQMSAQATEVINDLDKITPPSEFESYHKKMLETVHYIKSMGEAMLKKDEASVMSNLLSLLTSSMEGAQEMKRLYIKHNAPAQYVEQVDMAIEQVNAVFGKINQTVNN